MVDRKQKTTSKYLITVIWEIDYTANDNISRHALSKAKGQIYENSMEVQQVK